MADLELQKRFLGQGYTGHVAIEPALSWADQRNLEAAAAGAMLTAIELREVNRSMSRVQGALEAVAYTNTEIAFSVTRLEQSLGLRLDAQTDLLRGQLELLAQMNEALRTPARTRAAERIAQSAELMRRQQWPRAKELAEDAIDDDPTNPAAFTSAAWACIGLEAFDEAQSRFLDGAQVADGDTRARAVRQASRIAFVTDGPTRALELLEPVRKEALDDLERRALDFDRAVYLAESGDEDSAASALRAACTSHEDFCWTTLVDPVLARHPRLREVAAKELERIEALRGAEIREMEEMLGQLQASLDDADRVGYTPEETKRFALRDRAREPRERFESLRASGHDLPLVQLLQEIASLHNALQDLQIEASTLTTADSLKQLQARNLDSAVAKLCREEGAKLSGRDDTWAVVAKKGILRSKRWTLLVDEDANVSIVPGASV